MKTTLDLDDDLLIEAKSIAARRRTTLKALVEHALRREIRPASDSENPDPTTFEIGPFGILRLKHDPHSTVTHEQVRAIQAMIDEEDLQTALRPDRP